MTDKAQEANDTVLNDLLQLLPQNVGEGALILAMIGTVIGAGLWIGGVKMSRPIVTLFAVLLGAAIGLQLPKWFSWNVSGAGPSVGAALVLGLSGFVLHRMWIGLGLGCVAALWTTFGIFIAMHDPAHPWTWPAVDPTGSAMDYARSVWASVPPNMARVLPFATGAAIVSGLAACIIWPRLATAMHWSMLGMTMLIGLGIFAIAKSSHGDLIARFPQRPMTQGATLAALLLIGTAVQWRMSARPTKSSANAVPKTVEDELQ